MTVNIRIIIEVANKYTHKKKIRRKKLVMCSICLHDNDDDEVCNTVKQCSIEVCRTCV